MQQGRTSLGLLGTVRKGIPRMRLSFSAVGVRSTVLDEPNLVSHAGLVRAMALAPRARLTDLADRHSWCPSAQVTQLA